MTSFTSSIGPFIKKIKILNRGIEFAGRETRQNHFTKMFQGGSVLEAPDASQD